MTKVTKNIANSIGADETDEKQKELPFVAIKRTLSKWYDLRFNEITCSVEYREDTNSDYQEAKENDIFVRLLSSGFHISQSHLAALLYSDFVQKYNPFQKYFTDLQKWDEQTDYISMLANSVHAVDQKTFNHHFRKMLIRSIACALNEKVFNKHCFVIVGPTQNSGKSSFCRYLCPPKLSAYFAESIDPSKDGQIALCENFLINLDELSTLSKFETNHLKAYFSKETIKIRHPFAKKSQADPRRCSFIASTNEDTFLQDQTGSVRWLCFQITGLDIDLTKGGKNYRNIPIDKVWSQAYHLYKKGEKYQLTPEEIRDNETRNQPYQKISIEYESIQTYLEPGDSTNDFLTASSIITFLREKTNYQFTFNLDRIGKDLKALNFERKSKRTREQSNPVYGYFVKKITNDIL